MADRTTNGQLGEQLARIEERLSHMTHREQLAKELGMIRNQLTAMDGRIANIEKAMPIYDRAADRTDAAQEREKVVGESKTANRTLWTIIIGAVALVATIIGDTLDLFGIGK